VTAPDEKNLQELTARVSGPCGACHIPHNASGKRLWAKPLTTEENFGSQLCTGCHNKNGAAKAKLIGDNSHPVDVPFKETKIGRIHEQVAGVLPLYSEDGDRMDDGRILCITCHEPHNWDPRKPGPLENYEPQNVEGDTTNSFLRKANFPSPELCKICHVNEARVEGTVHDLSKTAPKAENFLGSKSQGHVEHAIWFIKLPTSLNSGHDPTVPLLKKQMQWTDYAPVVIPRETLQKRKFRL
jgi:predicted CXXCH cytochrome family protein